MTPSPPLSPPPARWRPRFSLATLMLVFLVCCVTAAGGRYLVQGLEAGNTAGRATFVISVLILPVLLLITVNAGRIVVSAFQRQKKRRR